MRHRKTFRKFSRTSEHRSAMMANLAMALIEHGRIKTTDAKAKDLRRVAEKLVTLGKDGSLAARRRVYAQLGGAGQSGKRASGERTRSQRTVEALFGSLAERFTGRPGGYTRIIKTNRRVGDNAPMSYIEMVGHEPTSNEEAEEE